MRDRPIVLPTGRLSGRLVNVSPEETDVEIKFFEMGEDFFPFGKFGDAIDVHRTNGHRHKENMKGGIKLKH